jgi:hypothetical protein
MSTYAELKTELAARGFDHLSATRRGDIVNAAVAELDELHRWPYREKAATGISPLSIADLGDIEAVINTSQDDQALEREDYQTLLDWYQDLDETGTPHSSYVALTSRRPVVATFPSNDTDTIGVQYWRSHTTLVADADTPIAPTRYHHVYLLIAQRMAESERGNFQAVEALQAQIERSAGRMVNALLTETHTHQRVTYASEDWS